MDTMTEDEQPKENADCDTSETVDYKSLQKPGYFSNWRGVFVGLCLAAGNALTGCVLGYSTRALTDMNSRRHYFPLSLWQETWFLRAVPVALAISSLTIGRLLEALGRKKVLAAGLSVLCLGWSLVVVAAEPWHACLGRTATGIGASLTSGCISGYTTEIWPRAPSFLLDISFFILGSNLIDDTLQHQSWREAATWSLLASAVALAVVLLFVPESPSWLCSKDRHREASDVLRWLNGRADVDPEMQVIQRENAASKERQQKNFYRYMLMTFAMLTLELGVGLTTVIEYVVYQLEAFILFLVDRYDRGEGSLVDVATALGGLLVILVFRFRRPWLDIRRLWNNSSVGGECKNAEGLVKETSESE